jgi:hypothetical protein
MPIDFDLDFNQFHVCIKFSFSSFIDSSGTPASSTTKTGRHDIAEILLKVALKHQKSKKNILFQRLIAMRQREQ